MKLALAILILAVCLAITLHFASAEEFKAWTEKPASSMSMSDLALMIILFTFLMPRQNKS